MFTNLCGSQIAFAARTSKATYLELKSRIKKSKDFLVIMLGLLGFHIIEDTIWLVLARYTEVPFWLLITGVAAITILMTKFVRGYHSHGGH